MSKRYYWLKLKEDFFRDKAIKKLRRIAGGDTYTIIYLKMLLSSMRDDGKIFFEGVEDTIAEEIALEIDEDCDNVKITINYLVSVGLIDICEGDMVLNQIPSMTGSECDSASRVRKYRETKTLQCNGKSLPSNTGVTSCNTELEKDKEKDKEIILSKDNIRQTEVRRLAESWNLLSVFGIPKISKMSSTSQRYQMASARINQYGIDEVLRAVENIKESSFLQGSTGFVITFDWFVKPNNFPKVLDGNYTDKKTNEMKPSSFDYNSSGKVYQ